MMATPNEKLASSLEELHRLQNTGQRVIQSSQLTRTHRERLIANGFLREIVKGWLMPSRPDEREGDTTAWYASMRDFIRGYCDQKFGDQWHVNPELSILLHTGSAILPQQIQINTPLGKGNFLQLPAGTSLFDYKFNDWSSQDSITEVLDLRVMRLARALVLASPSFYQRHTMIARQALWQLQDQSELNGILLQGQHTIVAGRIAGALRAVGRPDFADEVVAAMRAAGYKVREDNPFDTSISQEIMRQESPYAMRIRSMWASMREDILPIWGKDPVEMPPLKDYLDVMSQRYLADAYHSLSIEGYQVTAALIERVRDGNWNPQVADSDFQQKNAMAAKGYDLAHKAVRMSVEKFWQDKNAGEVLKLDHASWYRALFAPSVQVGLLKPTDLAGYRNHQVYIRNALHVPLPVSAVRDTMSVLFDLIANESSGAVRALLGHFIFVYIHPYMDGNGRIGRFIMNALLASCGRPWTVITVDVRAEYMAALEEASVKQNIRPFALLVMRLMNEQMKLAPTIQNN